MNKINCSVFIRYPLGRYYMLSQQDQFISVIPEHVQYSLTKIVDGEDASLFPGEQKIIEKAHPKRREEFIAGRDNARKLLNMMGVERCPILSGNNREPLWPSGIIGSISHCDTYCFVALTKKIYYTGLGVDVEPCEKLPRHLVNMVCTDVEKKRIEILSKKEPSIPWDKVFFSAKESTYKCIFPIIKEFIDFMKVEINIDAKGHTFSAKPTKNELDDYYSFIFSRLRGKVHIQNDSIFTVASV